MSDIEKEVVEIIKDILKILDRINQNYDKALNKEENK